MRAWWVARPGPIPTGPLVAAPPLNAGISAAILVVGDHPG